MKDLTDRVLADRFRGRSGLWEQMEGLVLIERFYYNAESVHGISLALEILLARIRNLCRSLGGCYDELATAFVGRFTSRVPLDSFWADKDFYAYSVNGHRTLSSEIANTATAIFNPIRQSGNYVLSLPAEIIRHILHLGAESFLPAIGSTLEKRRTLHLRRSHYLTHAALAHSIFRHEAQLELVSFAYAREGSTLNKLLDFVQRANLGLEALRLDYWEREGELDKIHTVWGQSLARLNQIKVLSTLTFLDLGGRFGSAVF